MATQASPVAIGDDAPGYSSATIRPVARVESWGPVAVPLETIDPAEIYLETIDPGTGARCRVYPAWSAPPEWRLVTPGARAALLVRATVTGRAVVRWGGARWIRGRLEIVGDGEASRFLPCWLIVGEAL